MKGKSAIVTGAAAGLGRATALRLAKAGANLCIVDVDGQGLESTRQTASALGADVVAEAVDLGAYNHCRAVVDGAFQRFDRIDALCNIAAVFMPRHAAEMAQAEFERTLAVNLAAPFYLIQACIPHLLKTQGAVVNVTSCAALIGQAYTAAYAATKAGLTHMTKALALEFMNKGIRFNTVAPGGMMTKLAAGLRDLKGADPALLGRISPMRGLVEIDDVAEMVAFLASDAARGYHGATISIDNGIAAG